MAVITALFSAGCNSKVFKAYMDKSDGEGIFLPSSVITPDTSSPDFAGVTRPRMHTYGSPSATIPGA